jgi:acyl-coenzyme A synthetase/AMP-(fatty) acid ligase
MYAANRACPSEIESVLLKHDEVKEAAVTVMKDAEGQARLAAYIDPAASKPDLRFCKAFLPFVTGH